MKLTERVSRRRQRAVSTLAIMVMLVSGLLPVGERAYEEDRRSSDTETPIKHLVVIFKENVSFDYYFATYHHAWNLPGEPVFTAHHLGRR